jgi:16S rRNA (guanine966-N2)-methyltransferase
MRIIAGEFRGRKLVSPRGGGTRPTPDRVREALFSILGETVEGARVVELFAGTGSLGLEALSRGAAHVVFCEKNRVAFRCLLENVRSLGVAERATPLAASAFDLPRRPAGRAAFDLVFCDPPFRMFDEAPSRRRLEELLAALPLTSTAVVVVEHRAGHLADFSPPDLRADEVRKWGSTGLAFYSPAATGESRF